MKKRLVNSSTNVFVTQFGGSCGSLFIDVTDTLYCSMVLDRHASAMNEMPLVVSRSSRSSSPIPTLLLEQQHPDHWAKSVLDRDWNEVHTGNPSEVNNVWTIHVILRGTDHLPKQRRNRMILLLIVTKVTVNYRVHRSAGDLHKMDCFRDKVLLAHRLKNDLTVAWMSIVKILILAVPLRQTNILHDEETRIPSAER